MEFHFEGSLSPQIANNSNAVKIGKFLFWLCQISDVDI
jgi:hypothetical protein